MDSKRQNQSRERRSGGVQKSKDALSRGKGKQPLTPKQPLFKPRRPFNNGQQAGQKRLFGKKGTGEKTPSGAADAPSRTTAKPADQNSWKKRSSMQTTTAKPQQQRQPQQQKSTGYRQAPARQERQPTQKKGGIPQGTQAGRIGRKNQLERPAQDRQQPSGAAPSSSRSERSPMRRPISGLRRPPKVDPVEESLRRRAQPYDWGKTAKFSPDQKKFLERVFKQFSDYVTTKMAPLVQTRVSIEYQDAKLRPYSNFIQSLYEPLTMVIMRVDPEHRGLIVIDFPLSFALIDKCLGGKGEPLEEVRYFTEIEEAVLQRVSTKFIESYQEAWNELIKECKPQFVEMQFNPQMVHIVKPSEMMVCVSFDVRISHAQGPIYIVLPFEYLKTTLPKANFEEFMLTRSSSAQATPTVAPLFAKNLEQAKVPVSVELGSTELLFHELAVLEVGDFIKLDQEITQPLRVKVNERVKFLGRPGVRENRIAVQLTKVLQEGDEEFEE